MHTHNPNTCMPRLWKCRTLSFKSLCLVGVWKKVPISKCNFFQFAYTTSGSDIIFRERGSILPHYLQGMNWNSPLRQLLRKATFPGKTFFLKCNAFSCKGREVVLLSKCLCCLWHVWWLGWDERARTLKAGLAGCGGGTWKKSNLFCSSYQSTLLRSKMSGKLPRFPASHIMRTANKLAEKSAPLLQPILPAILMYLRGKAFHLSSLYLCE